MSKPNRPALIAAASVIFAFIGFDAADVTADTSVIEKAGATGGLKDAAKRGMTNSTKLNGIVRVKYQNNPQKLAAWTVASHLEKPPKTNETP